MNLEKLTNMLSVGKKPITIDFKIVYKGIHRYIRISEENLMFLDFESDYYSSGGLRISFFYRSVNEMIESRRN